MTEPKFVRVDWTLVNDDKIIAAARNDPKLTDLVSSRGNRLKNRDSVLKAAKAAGYESILVVPGTGDGSDSLRSVFKELPAKFDRRLPPAIPYQPVTMAPGDVVRCAPHSHRQFKGIAYITSLAPRHNPPQYATTDSAWWDAKDLVFVRRATTDDWKKCIKLMRDEDEE